jgi:hypothetical protein
MTGDETRPVTVKVDKAPDNALCMSTGPSHPAHVKVTVGDSEWLWCVNDWRSARSVFMERGHGIAYGKGAAEHIAEIASTPAGQDATAQTATAGPLPCWGFHPW